MNEDELFGAERAGEAADVPLANRLAPEKLEQFAGQRHILAEGKMLRRLIEADMLRSAVFFGPPGTGKTALARLIAAKTSAVVREINAAIAATAELKEILKEAAFRSGKMGGGKRTLVILDEIHHFNRTQQDVLLPSVERGEIILIGLTTENPHFYINNALISRFAVFEFQPLSEKDLSAVLKNALADSALSGMGVSCEPEAEKHLVLNSGGDARRLLNALELAVLTTKPQAGKRLITLETAQESIQKRALRYDKSSDEHYDHISAFIKSMRGTAPDAAVYWLAKMLEAGEDPRFLARRILICAAEDVGLADPLALVVAEAAFRAAEELGMPEARIPLSEAAVYVACAPKSNAAYMAVESAIAEVKNGPAREVPLHLRDANLDGETRGHGKGYKYPHDYPGHYTPQEYLPEPKKFYFPSAEGREAAIAERLKKLKQQNA